jgi:MFS family permease
LLALALAAHVKLTALILAPVVGLWLARRCGWRRAISLGVAAALVGLALSWLLYAPFGGWATLPRMLEERAAFLANSPWHLLNRVFRDQAGWPAETSRRITVGLSMCLAVAGSLLIALWMLDFRPRRWKAAPAVDWSDDRLLWRTVAAVSLFYLLLGSFWFQHWYLVWVLAPAALLPDSRLTRGLLPWLGFGALSANVMSSFVPALASSPPSKVTMAALLVAIIWVPMLVAVAGGRGPRLRGTKLAETG